MNRALRCGILAVAGIGAVVVAVAAILAPARASRFLPGIGEVEYLTFENRQSDVMVKRTDRSSLHIHYQGDSAQDITVVHPAGHPLQPKVQPLPDQATLHAATVLKSELMELARGRKEKPSDEASRLLLYSPPTQLYDLPFEKRAGHFHLSEGGVIFPAGHVAKVGAKSPFAMYWGPEGPGPDGLGDDLLYCGYLEYEGSLPIRPAPGSVHRIKAGDSIRFESWTFHIENIDHDGDGDKTNNKVFVRLEGPSIGSAVQEWLNGRPATPAEFLAEVCWPQKPSVASHRDHPPAFSLSEIEDVLKTLAKAETNGQRGQFVAETLKRNGYPRDRLFECKNPTGMKDYWAIKAGKGKEVCIIAAHYDKIGEGSQGVIDNGGGVTVVLGTAKALLKRETKLNYVFLLYGGEEIGHNWDAWLLRDSGIKEPIRYVVHLEGPGLRGAQPAFRMHRGRYRGWLHWFSPVLYVNQDGGDPRYLKHTSTDSLEFCDYSLVKAMQDSLLEWISVVEASVALSKDSQASPRVVLKHNLRLL